MDRPGPPDGRGLTLTLPEGWRRHPLVVGLLARCNFPAAGAAVTCAVSGGADSSALLVLAVAAGLEVTAVHVDHQSRPGSAAEAELVAALAAACGARFRATRVEVADGPNLEARWRTARRSVLPTDALTGHTADDRAETVLLNMLRGAGPAGAAGIPRGPTHPLLDLRRSETEALAAALELPVVRDPGNLDPRFRRTRVRHELLPLAADVGARDPVPVLIRQADLFAEIASHLAREAAAVDPTSVADLRAASRPVAGEAVRRWLLDAGVGDGYPADAAAVDRVLCVARGEVRATEVAGGWRVARSRGRLSLSAPRDACPEPAAEPAAGAWQDASHD